MDEKTRALCESFITNRDVVKKVFRGDSVYIYPVAANAITAAGATADPEKLKQCKKMLKKKASYFSYMKGTISTPFAANLSVKEDPAAQLERVAKIYKVTKKQFSRSEFTALLALMLSDYVPEENIESVVARGKEIYDEMKKDHPFLTSEQSSVWAGLLALSEKSNTELLEDMEKCYDLLKIKFSSKSSIHTVSHVLALTDGSAREKVEHLIDLYDSLKDSKKKFSPYGELAVLAAVSILDHDTEKLRDTILEIDDFLATQKGYGFFGLDKKTRLMHAAMLTTDLYDTAQAATGESPTPAAIAMAAAQQLAICIVITSVIMISGAGAVN